MFIILVLNIFNELDDGIIMLSGKLIDECKILFS